MAQNSKISYPFAAIPNHVARGGHGGTNMAVLAALMSHGTVTASVATLAREAGVNVKSARSAIRYWLEMADDVGLVMLKKGGGDKTGIPIIYEIRVLRMDDPLPKTVDPPLPKTVDPPLPKTVVKEEQEQEDQIGREHKQQSAPDGAGVDPKQVAEIIDAFASTVSPTLKFGNVTQRKASEDLIVALGFDKALEAARFAVSVQGREYAPTVTTPAQLSAKLGALRGYWQRERGKAPSVVVID